jgi:hypothetical protein
MHAEHLLSTPMVLELVSALKCLGSGLSTWVAIANNDIAVMVLPFYLCLLYFVVEYNLLFVRFTI